MKKTLSIISIMMLFCLFAVKMNAQTTPDQNKTTTTVSTAEITFDALEHDYGTINKGADGNCEFTFKNTGKEPLLITDCKASCGCTIPSWTKEPILPGKKGSIHVKYNTERIGGIDKSVTVTSNAKNSPVVLHIKGNVLDVPQTTVTPTEEKK